MSARRGAGQPSLFDLELDPPEPIEGHDSAEAERGSLLPDLPPDLDGAPPPVAEVVAGAPLPAPWPARAFAGATDLVVHLAVLALVLGGVRLLGVRASVADLPALALLLLVFSLFYTVVPLAFWGQTPGMAAAGLRVRSLEGEPLSFGQAALRWLGALAVVLSAGLLALVGIGGVSLLDRLSGSRAQLS
jgi:uncharacterized RDD family membrane protein YckC